MEVDMEDGLPWDVEAKEILAAMLAKNALWPQLHPHKLETGVDDYKRGQSIRAEKVMW